MFKKYGGHKRGRDEVIFINAEKRKDKGMCGERETERLREGYQNSDGRSKEAPIRQTDEIILFYLFIFFWNRRRL